MPHVRQILDELRALSAGLPFNPATAAFTFTIAADDYQQRLLLPPLMKQLAPQAHGMRLRVIPFGTPDTDLLRDDICDPIIQHLFPRYKGLFFASRYFNYQFTPVTTLQLPLKCVQSVFETLNHILLIFHFPFLQPLTHIAAEMR